MNEYSGSDTQPISIHWFHAKLLLPLTLLCGLVFIFLYFLFKEYLMAKAHEELMTRRLNGAPIQSVRHNYHRRDIEQVHQSAARHLNRQSSYQTLLIQQLIAENEFLQSQLQSRNGVAPEPARTSHSSEDSPPSYQECLENLR